MYIHIYINADATHVFDVYADIAADMVAFTLKYQLKLGIFSSVYN